MVGVGRKEQAILSVEALLVARVPPRLAVACAQMLFARDARDAARTLDPHHVRLERPLHAPRKKDGDNRALPNAGGRALGPPNGQLEAGSPQNGAKGIEPRVASIRESAV